MEAESLLGLVVDCGQAVGEVKRSYPSWSYCKRVVLPTDDCTDGAVRAEVEVGAVLGATGRGPERASCWVEGMSLEKQDTEDASVEEQLETAEGLEERILVESLEKAR